MFEEIPCPQCGKRRNYLRIDGTIRCSTCGCEGVPGKTKTHMNDIIRTWSRGNSTGIVIPYYLCQKMGIKLGTLLSLVVSDDGKTITLTPCGFREPAGREPAHITSALKHSSKNPKIKEPKNQEPIVEVYQSRPVPALISIWQRLFKKK